MFPHVAWLNEGLLTDGADVVPLSSVRGRVALQVGLLHEGLAAVGADKLLLSLVVTQVVLRDKNALNAALRRVYAMPKLENESCLGHFVDSDVLRTWYAECDRNLFSHCGHLYLIHRMRSELLVALSAVVPFLPGVQGDVRFQVGFLREALATEGAEEGLLHLHVFVYLTMVKR